MKLKRLWLDGYKNLKCFELGFSDRNSCTVIIGNNGSGKSNILEAISVIFWGVHNTPSRDYTSSFQYEIEYQVRGHDVALSWKRNETTGENEQRIVVAGNVIAYDKSDELKEYLPSQVIATYSGEEKRLWDNIYSHSYFQFVDRVKTEPMSRWSSFQRMVYVNRYCWDIALLTLLFAEKTETEESFSSFRKNILGIEEIKFITFEIDVKKQTEWFSNEIIDFVGKLNPDKKAEVTISIADFIELYEGSNAEFYGILSAASMPKTDKIIKNIHISFSESLTISSLSEGEKKLLLVYTVLCLLADNDALLLFDEPDSHIHIKRKQDLAGLFLDNDFGESEKIITTHSPTLTNAFDNDHLAMLENINGKVKLVSTNNQEAVATLTDGIWNAHEQNIFLNSDNDILLVEGKTDETFISRSLEVLQQEDARYNTLNFEYLPCGGAEGVKLLLNKFTPKASQTIIAFFDSDQSGWSAINDIMGEGKSKYKSENFSFKKKNSIYISVYPQRPYFRGSNFNIEDYFPKKCLNKYVLAEFRGLDSVVTKNAVKRKIDSDSEKRILHDSDYKYFRVLFDHILEIKDTA